MSKHATYNFECIFNFIILINYTSSSDFEYDILKLLRFRKKIPFRLRVDSTSRDGRENIFLINLDNFR